MIEASVSLDIGSVRVWERFLPDDPPTQAQIAAARAYVDDLLDDSGIPFERAAGVVGVAGTATTIAALATGRTEHGTLQGVTLTSDQLRRTTDWLISSTQDERRRRREIHPGRVEVIGAGALILQRVYDRVAGSSAQQPQAGGVRGEEVRGIRISEADILDGIAAAIP